MCRLAAKSNISLIILDYHNGMTEGAYQGKRSGFGFRGIGQGMTFNRPSSSERRGIEVPGFVKPGINYGSVAGSSAKFIGQGILNLRRGAAAAPYCQWKCAWFKSNPNAQNFDRMKVNLGLINGVIPTPVNGILSASPGGTKYVILTCTTDGKMITEAALSVTNTMPTPSASTAEAAPSSFKYPIAVTDEYSISMLVGCGPITVSVRPSITEDSTGYTAGQRNYIIYYNWY